MIYLLWAAVVGLAVCTVLAFVHLTRTFNHNVDVTLARARKQNALNDQVKEKLRLVGQHID